jgi:23S rRNA (uracil1939-C5)-methyltransferase
MYSGLCGGCKWQFLSYQKQLEYKRRHVLESLAHIGLIRDVPVHPAIASPSMFGYRNKMEFSCADRRWLLPEEMARDDIDRGFALGLHVPGTFYKVLDISSCLLQPALGNRILAEVRNFIKDSARPVYGLRSHEGFWRFLVLRHSVARDQWMVNIVTASEDRSAVQPLADLLTARYPKIVSMVNNITSRKAGIAVGETEILLAGASCIREKVGGYEFEISANSFFQTNTLAAQRLVKIVKDFSDLSGRETLVDLYCGTGAIAISLAEEAGKVIGMEIAESAIMDAEKNCRLNGISNCEFIQGDIKNSLAKIAASPDIIIIDPPRAGMHKDIVRQVLAMKPEKMVYVSCNPTTMARDLAMMTDDYEVIEIQPVDMFPHTHHVESVAKINRKTHATLP